MKSDIRSPLLSSPVDHVDQDGTGLRDPASLAAKQRRRRAVPKLQTQWDSFSFDTWYSAVYEAFLFARQDWDFRKVTILRWIVNFFIGTAVALVAVFISYASKSLTAVKFQALNSLIDLEQNDNLRVGLAPLCFVAISVGYSALASFPVAFIEPAAGGSGIPEIKTILNGVALGRVLRLKTLACKVFSVVFSVSSGLPVGKEGPMVHSGASIAAGITQGKSRTFGFDTRWSVHEAFRNDKEKRDFISCGAAAGVAAAFGAPVGGLLFAVEEGTTHWFRALVWRIFFCTMVASFMLDFFNSGIEDQWGNLGNPGMFNFGAFGSGTIWSIQELPLYIIIGAYGGLQGGAFNYANKVLSRWRFRHVPVASPCRRFLEVLVLTAVFSTVTFGLSFVYSSCLPRPPPDSTAPYISDLVSFYCPDSDYNELASLFMVSSENAIKQLFHSKEAFGLGHLGVFYIVYSLLSCLTYGISVASGLFIPSLLSGSALGRFIGEVLIVNGFNVDAGTFALIGSAAVLGGTTRMTVSLLVILLETTGNYQLGLPLMVTLITARFIGNFLGEGIYDLHISLRGWPLLPEHLPKLMSTQLRVRDVMTKAPRVLQEIERVGDVIDLMQSTSHNGFPVVYSPAALRTYPRIGSLAGLVMRKHLAVLLVRKAFHADMPTMPFQVDQVDRQQSGPAAISAYSIALASPVKGLDRPPPGMPSSPMGGSRRTGASFLVREPSQSDMRPRAGTESSHVLLRLPAADGGLLQGMLRDGGVLPPRTSFAVAGVASLNRGNVIDVATAAPKYANAERLFEVDDGEDVLEMLYTDEPLVNYRDVEHSYPHYPDVSALRLSAAERAMFMDLRPYLSPTPTTVHVHSPVTAAFNMFKSLALRHLLVVNDCHDVVGIVTRHDLLISRLRECLVRMAKHTSSTAPSNSSAAPSHMRVTVGSDDTVLSP